MLVAVGILIERHTLEKNHQNNHEMARDIMSHGNSSIGLY